MLSAVTPEHFRALMDLELMTFCAGCRMFESSVGRVVVNPAYALLYDANFVILRHWPEGEGIKELEARIRPFVTSAGVSHYRFLLDPFLGQQWGAAFAEAQYRQSGYLLMESRNVPSIAGSSEVVLRRVQDRRDQAALDRIESDLMRETTWNSPMVRSTLRSRRRELSRCLDLEWYVAWWGKEPAGSIGLLKSGLLGSIQSVSTRPVFRGRHVASAMVVSVLARARELGLTAVSLLTEVEDWPQHLYVRLGFESIGILESWVRDLGLHEA